MANNIIILLEDDLYLAEVFRVALEGRGYQVLHRVNSEGLESIVRSFSPVLLITELVMPRHDGLEGIFSLPDGIDLPVIALDARQKYLELARPVADEVLKKPVAPAELVARVDRLLNHSTVSRLQ